MANVNWDGGGGGGWRTYNSDETQPLDSQPSPFPTLPAAPTSAPTAPSGSQSTLFGLPSPQPSSGFGHYQWQQTPEGQDFYNRLKSDFPWLTDADLSANLGHIDTMPDQRYRQAIISNFRQHPPTSAATSTTTPTTETPGGPQNGDYQGWFNSLVAGKPWNQQTLLDLEPTLKQYGIDLTPPNSQGERTKINIPGVGWVRVGFSEGHPVWIPQGDGSPGPVATGNAGTSADDPLRALYQLMSLSRVGKLGGAPYTTGEDAALRARYMDPLTHARDARLAQNKEELGRYGYLPSSGLAMHRTDMANKDYESAVGQASNDTAIRAVDESQRRQDEQLQILDALLNEGRSYRTEQHGYDQTDFLNSIAQLNALVNAGGGGSDATNLLQQILSIGNANQNAQQIANGNRQATSSAWGSMLPYILQAVGIGPTAAR